MTEIETIPEDCREGYARLISWLVKEFSIDKRSGSATLDFKEGVPKILKPTPNIHLDR